jgi:uncharacterized membrane protein
LYAVFVIVGGWMALATWGPLRLVDPFPFPFLLFLDNVVQLVLCLVILVGQRVLGGAADRRAVQTYENAEAIFAQVSDLQAHLDRHDRALSRGVSLLESSPHPWIEQHRVQPPPQARDQVVGVNDRIAAWLTRRLGSVWAFYLAAGTQVVWIVLAQLGVQRVDLYPFAFMTFLSTLVQLIFMIVIMVGQDVLGRAGDRRSEQTFHDTEAILHECRRMKARLTTQERVIDRLAGYATTQITEQLAQAIHDADPDTAGAQDPGDASRDRGGDGEGLARRWDELPDEARETSRARARQIGENLAGIGCLMVPTVDPTLSVNFDEDEVRLLAQLEHERRIGREAARPAGYPAGAGEAGDPVPWDQLPERVRAKHLNAARRIPAMLERAGFQVLREGRGVDDGPTEADFAAGEWDILQRSMMASGVLVALAEGAVDPEEIFALIKKLREVSITHPRRFIRDLAAASTFDTGLRAGTSYADYTAPALEVIRSAAGIVARTAPAELADFRTLLNEIAETVGDANQEGGFYGLGAHRRYGNEATAIAAIRAATELDAPGHTG